MKKTNRKTSIVMRIQPDLLERIDAIRASAGFHTRTDLIETGLAAYVEYLEEIEFKNI